MKTNFTKGCAICGSTWGNYWGEIEGENMFFCCDVCYLELRNLVASIKQTSGWDKLDEITVEGNYAGRNCQARSGQQLLSFFVAFDSKGEVSRFEELRKNQS